MNNDNNPYNINQDNIDTTKSELITYVSYDSRCRNIFLGHNTCTGPRKVMSEMVTLTQGPLLNIGIKYQHQRVSQKKRLFEENIINNLTIKSNLDPRIVYSDIIFSFPTECMSHCLFVTSQLFIF